jgi:hypothetical protein
MDEESIGFPRPFCVVPNPADQHLLARIAIALELLRAQAQDDRGGRLVADGEWCVALPVFASRESR